MIGFGVGSYSLRQWRNHDQLHENVSGATIAIIPLLLWDTYTNVVQNHLTVKVHWKNSAHTSHNYIDVTIDVTILIRQHPLGIAYGGICILVKC